MQKQLTKKVLIKRGVIIISLILAIYLLMVFADHPQAVEKYYSNGLYPFICHVLHPVLNLFPFSVGDIVYVIVIGYLIFAFVKLIALCVKKRFLQAAGFLAGLIISLQVSILVFYIFWGMNYFRPSAAERLDLRDSTFTTAELKSVTALLIDSANACRARVTATDLKQTNDTIYNNGVKAIHALSRTSSQYQSYSPGIKPSLLTPLLNYIGTSGYYNPFTTEAQINYQMPVFSRPFVVCHELSHQIGYGPEDEANFAGFMAATASKDKLLRYSAYHLAVAEFMSTMYYRDSLARKELKKRLSPAVLNDFKEEHLYWLSYQNKLNVITGIFYDNFLKANNQPEGIDTYNRMVLLVMALYKKQAPHA